MSFEIKSTTNVKTSIRAIAKKQIGKAISDATIPPGGTEGIDRHEIVHRIRTRCKKLRAILRLVRPALGDTYQLENQTIRDAADSVGSIRDTKVVLETLDDVVKQTPHHQKSEFIDSVRQNLLASLNAITDDHIDQQLSRFRDLMSKVDDRVNDWRLRASGFGVIGDGLRQIHERAVGRLKFALKDRSDESLHEFRKETKYHRHHMRLLKPLWPALLTPYVAQLNELGELLGNEHNFAVLRETISLMDLKGRKKERKRMLEMLDQQSSQLKSQAYVLGQRVFAEQTDAFMDRIHAYWKICKQ
jgi:CHAD domain-containing protein